MNIINFIKNFFIKDDDDDDDYCILDPKYNCEGCGDCDDKYFDDFNDDFNDDFDDDDDFDDWNGK